MALPTVDATSRFSSCSADVRIGALRFSKRGFCAPSQLLVRLQRFVWMYGHWLQHHSPLHLYRRYNLRGALRIPAGESGRVFLPAAPAEDIDDPPWLIDSPGLPDPITGPALILRYVSGDRDVRHPRSLDMCRRRTVITACVRLELVVRSAQEARLLRREGEPKPRISRWPRHVKWIRPQQTDPF